MNCKIGIRVFLSVGISLSPLLSIAQEHDYGAWRALTPDEEKARIGDTPPGSVDPSMIKADFDGDGKIDTALIAVRKEDLARVLVFDMNWGAHVHLGPEGSESVGPEDGLGLAKPGRWDTICGNAFRELQGGLCESENYPRAVTLKNPGLLHISAGETLLYYWDRKTKAFKAVSLRN